MTYGFKMDKMNVEELLSEVSMGLQKITELMAREALPNLWKYTDKLNARNGIKEQDNKLQGTIRRIWGLLLVALGIFLLVPGILKPQELLVPLIMGIVAILVGIKNLVKRERKNSFDKSAKLLLEKINTSLEGKIVTVAFLEDRMEIPIIVLDNGNREDEVVTYSEFKYVIENKNTFLLVYNDKALVLEKKNIMQNNVEEFSEFVSAKVSYIDLTKEII